MRGLRDFSVQGASAPRRFVASRAYIAISERQSGPKKGGPAGASRLHSGGPAVGIGSPCHSEFSMRLAAFAVAVRGHASAQVPSRSRNVITTSATRRASSALRRQPGCDREAHFLLPARACEGRFDRARPAPPIAAASLRHRRADWQLSMDAARPSIDVPRPSVAQDSRTDRDACAVGGSIATHTKIGWL